MIKIALRSGGMVEVDAAGRTKITSPDGRSAVYGAPQNNPEQAATARELGYGDDPAAMVADHDPLHALLADWLGLPESASLFGGPPEVERAEEAAVLAVQKFMRLAGGRLPIQALKGPHRSHKMHPSVCVNCGLDDNDPALCEPCCPDEWEE